MVGRLRTFLDFDATIHPLDCSNRREIKDIQEHLQDHLGWIQLVADGIGDSILRGYAPLHQQALVAGRQVPQVLLSLSVSTCKHSTFLVLTETSILTKFAILPY